MSILIKGMQMPKNCGECPIEQLYGRDCETAKCPITKNLDSAYRVSQARMFGCPLVELPPHGRLIDADALNELIDSGDDIDFSEVLETKYAIMQMVREQETIIEADSTQFNNSNALDALESEEE